MHSTWSDGAHSIEEMVEASRAKGYSHIVITDHSDYLKVANGLSKERLLKQIETIHELNNQYADIEIFAGTEMDILPDGSLDFDDDLLKQLDFVIASIHSSFSQPQEKIMERLYNAIKNPYVHMIAHPTGRIIEQRNGYNPDVPTLNRMGKGIWENFRIKCKSISTGLTNRIFKTSARKRRAYCDQYRCPSYRSTKIYGYRCTLCTKSMAA